MTPREAQIVKFIRHYRADRGFAPTTQEIAAGLGLASRSGVHRHLVALRKAGRLEWEPHHTRTLRVVADEP